STAPRYGGARRRWLSPRTGPSSSPTIPAARSGASPIPGSAELRSADRELADPRRRGEAPIMVLEPEVRVVAGVVLQHRAPAPLHIGDLGDKAAALVGVDVRPARGGFVVIKLGMGRPYDAVAALADAQAQIDVIEGDREVALVEPADLGIDLGRHHEAGGGHRRQVLD